MILNTLLAVGLDKSQINNLPTGDVSTSTLRTVLQLITGLAGAVAFLVIVVSGLRYTISRGKPEEVNKAKNSIIYAVAGLLIAMTAFSIVTFVVGKL